MGSKRKLINEIWQVSSKFEFDSVIDLFSGSGVVSYMYKAHGKQVISNDYMQMNTVLAQALIENNTKRLSKKRALKLLEDTGEHDDFVEKTFKGLYFTDDENKRIDILRSNIQKIRNKYER